MPILVWPDVRGLFAGAIMTRLIGFWSILLLIGAGVSSVGQAADPPLRITSFEADVTPPIGAPLCGGGVMPAKEIVDKLWSRGVVLFPAGDKPIVLCAVDWVGISNGGNDAFRDELAAAAGTTRERVAVHCLHQHDAPSCDFFAEELLAPHGLGGRNFDVAFARTALKRISDALAASLKQPQPVTHVGYGKGKVEQVASNRRVLGPDGKVKASRWSATESAELRAEPEGTIDPYVHLVSFWNGETPVATLSYYATHPQSYYGKGGVSCDFPGLARATRDREQLGVVHVHFNGAAGNVTAGKYNDGAPENRPVLAARLAAGMRAAWDATQKSPLRQQAIAWRVRPTALPPAKSLELDKLRATLNDPNAAATARTQAGRKLSWVERCAAGRKIDIACLWLGPIAVLHMPGELFVEYQLAAQQMRPGSPVVMAAYGDGGPGYIGLEKSYAEGGYETGVPSSVAPEVEGVLMQAMRELLSQGPAGR
jgi:hypothetical protein